MNSSAFLQAIEAYDRGDIRAAAQLMEGEARRGSAKACYFMSLWNRNGDLPINHALSQFWLDELHRIAGGGDATAQWDLGQCYRFGDLVAIDIEEANRWLELAAGNGCPDAQFHLGYFIEHGDFGYERDPGAAMIWYERAIAGEHPEAMYRLAAQRLQMSPDSPDAMDLLRRSAAKGFMPAVEALSRVRH